MKKNKTRRTGGILSVCQNGFEVTDSKRFVSKAKDRIKIYNDATFVSSLLVSTRKIETTLSSHTRHTGVQRAGSRTIIK